MNPGFFMALIIASLTIFLGMIISSIVVLFAIGLLAAMCWFGILFYLILIAEIIRARGK